MKSEIEIFDETSSIKYFEVLMESINHLSLFKPDIHVTHHTDSQELLGKIKKRHRRKNGEINLEKLIKTAFRYKVFKEEYCQKIILLDELGWYDGEIVDGFHSIKNNCQSAIVLPVKHVKRSDMFYAVCCHELGHIYGALNRPNHLNKEHCGIKECVMYDHNHENMTQTKRYDHKPMYCKFCIDKLEQFLI